MRPPILSLLSLVAILLPQPAIGQTLEDLPPRKPGQWEIRMVTEKPGGVPEVSTQVCIDAQPIVKSWSSACACRRRHARSTP